MFVHRKKHPSGHVSIIVMDKSSGKLREVKNFGIAKSDSEADELYFESSKTDQGTHTGNIPSASCGVCPP